MEVNLTAVVNKFRNISYLQPMFEAVSNSLEAGANEVVITLNVEANLLDDNVGYMTGFSIFDNGRGFTQESISSFKTLWSSYKQELGCKGIGRLTWLKVFENISIESYADGNDVSINFTKNFNEETDITIKPSDHLRSSYTNIQFKDVTQNYYRTPSKGTIIDKRELADIDLIRNKLEKHLLVKLTFLKNQGQNFNIKLKAEDKEVNINERNIPELNKQSFEITNTSNTVFPFDLYYSFVENPDMKYVELHYCANNRAVSKFNENVSFTKVPDNNSVIMLLTSPYLDKMVNDERNEFSIKQEEDEEGDFENISFAEINRTLKQNVDEILSTRYPELNNERESILAECIEEYPYLAKYIREDKSLYPKKLQVIKLAKEKYEAEKLKIKSNFKNLLKKKRINEKDLFSSLDDVSEMASRELAAYISYRQQIIEAMKKMADNDEKIEKMIHNLFMDMRTESVNNEHSKISSYDSNLWLLDDKFLSYTYAASDMEINKIIKYSGIDIKEEIDRPDLAMFYSDAPDVENLSCVLVEIKPFGINHRKKKIGADQLRDYARTIYKNNNKIKDFWVYLVTKLDDDLRASLTGDDYIPLFSTAKGFSIFARYFSKEIPPIYVVVMSVEAIIQDAEARNKAFLDIIKKKN